MKNGRVSFCLTLAILLFLTAFLTPQTSDETYFERKTNERQPPQKVMDAIGLKPGMIIGEVGAGEGRYTVHLARRVGKTGRVYANDINVKSLEHLKKRCQENRLENVEIILGKVDDPLFPKGALNLCFMILTYHHLAKPVALLRNLIPSLKPGAVVAIVDPDPIKDGGRDKGETTSVEKMRKEAGEAGFEVIRVETFLEKDNIFLLRVKPSRDDRNAPLDGTKVRASAEKGPELTNVGRSGPTVVKSGYIEVDKARLYYEEQGQGKPLVMIHGGGLDRRNWDDQFDILAQH